MNTSNEMRVCVYSDTDQTVLKRCLECSDYQDFNIQGFETDKVNIYNGESFIKKCGIAKRLIPFELKPKLFGYIDHINVIGGHYYHIAVKARDGTSNKRRLGMVRRSLRRHGKILTDRPYDKNNLKYMEFSYEIPSSSIRHVRITFWLSIIGVFLSIISLTKSWWKDLILAVFS